MASNDPIPDFEAARDHVIVELIEFTQRLRREGVSMPSNASLDGARALSRMGIDDKTRTRHSLRATLLSDRRDTETFDEEFAAYWARLRAGLLDIATRQNFLESSGDEQYRSTVSTDRKAAVHGDFEGDAGPDIGRHAELDTGGDWEREPEGGVELRTTYSPEGVRTGVDLQENGHAEIDSALAEFERAVGRLPGRRQSPTVGSGRLDARRTLRENVRSGGVAFNLPRREPRKTEVNCCVLVDVSRSVLEAIDREFLLTLLDRFQDRNRTVRTFIFDTDIREVTGIFENSRESPQKAFERAGVEWGDGTRIGHSLRTLRREWPYAVDRRTILVVISDGLDVGDVSLLESEMAWLARRATGVLWLNPLADSPKYEPVCRGMAAALPYVDGLFAFTEAEDVSEIARQLDRHGIRGQIGYQHDSRRRLASER